MNFFYLPVVIETRMNKMILYIVIKLCLIASLKSKKKDNE
jgi:hypothetical protein